MLNTEDEQLFQSSSKIDSKEQEFRKQLKRYQTFYSRDEHLQEKTLLETAELQKFNHFCNHYSMNKNIITFDQKTVEYYLEKNFILNRYAGSYNYMTISSINHLFSHYQLLLTRNFDDIPLSLIANGSLKSYLANLYLHTMNSNDDLTSQLTKKHPEKVSEVASLLADYNAYQEGYVRPEETITQEDIDKPYTGQYVYKRKASIKR